MLSKENIIIIIIIIIIYIAQIPCEYVKMHVRNKLSNRYKTNHHSQLLPMTLFTSNIMSSAPKACNTQEESEANAHETGSHRSIDINAQ